MSICVPSRDWNDLGNRLGLEDCRSPDADTRIPVRDPGRDCPRPATAGRLVTDTAAPDIERLHAEWEAVHGELRKLEQVLSECLAVYARGHSARPDHLIAQVETLRAGCAQKFQALMAAVKTRP